MAGAYVLSNSSALLKRESACTKAPSFIFSCPLENNISGDCAQIKPPVTIKRNILFTHFFIYFPRFELVPKAGLEPAHPFGHYPLKVACLPIPPLRQFI